MDKRSPNVAKLIIKFIALEAIPRGGGIASGIEFFINPEHRKKVLESAESKAIQSINFIKSAPDNPFGDDDDVIAGELLKRIEERNAQRRRSKNG